MFKKSLTAKIILSGILASSLNQISAADIVIEKVSSLIFVQPGKGRIEKCKVGMNATEISVTYGSIPDNMVTTTRVVSESLSNDVQGVLKNSFNSSLVYAPNNFCDAPRTDITATYRGERFVLYSTGGCGQDRAERYDLSSQILKEIVNKHCPTTYDTNQ